MLDQAIILCGNCENTDNWSYHYWKRKDNDLHPRCAKHSWDNAVDLLRAAFSIVQQQWPGAIADKHSA